MSNDPDRLLSQSLLFRVLAAAYAYPDESFRESLASGAFSSALRAGIARLADGRLHERVDWLDHAIRSLAGAGIGLEEEYTALFQRTVPCSPYSSRYLVPSAIYRARVLAEVAGYYRALGLRPALDRPELPDHIGAELEFLGLAAARECQARQEGHDEAADRLREIRDRFRREHVLLWVPTFRKRLAKHARLDFYPAVTDVTLALLEIDQPVLVEPVGAGAADRLAREPLETDDGMGSSFDCGITAR